MTVDDVDAVTALDARAFGESAWSRRHFIGELTESPISAFYVLSDARGNLLGYFGTWQIVDQLQLCTFAVEPERQGLGLGSVLLSCVIRLAQRLQCVLIQLEVRASNVAARSLYANRGFVEEAVRRNFYSKPTEDGVLMGLETPSLLEEELTGRAGRRWAGGLELRWDDRGGSFEEHFAFRDFG